MRKLIPYLAATAIILLSVLVPETAEATFTKVQAIKSNAGCGGGTGTLCDITVSSTGTGNLLVAFLNLSAGTVSSVSNAGTWVHPSGCIATGGVQDIWYNLSSTSGVTTIHGSISNSNAGRDFFFFEYSGTSTFAFASCNNDVHSMTATTQPGIALASGGGVNYIFFQGMTVTSGGTYLSISSPYTGLAGSSTGRTTAYSPNSVAGAAPTWSYNTAAANVTTGIAFYEISKTVHRVITGLMFFDMFPSLGIFTHRQ